MRTRRFNPTLPAAACALIGIVTGAAAQPVLYVDDDAPPGGDGLTWPTACRYLQDALAIAAIPANGITEIHVAQGTYTPDCDTSIPGCAGDCLFAHGGLGCPDADCEAAVCATLPTCCDMAWDATCVTIAFDLCGHIRAATFQLINGVALMGGYAGLEAPDPNERDVGLYETVLSGDLVGNDGPGLFDNNDENSLHVTTGSGTDVTAVIDGFTITAGNGNGAGWPQLDADAGGMLNNTGSPSVNRCRFEANRAVEGGAGMSNDWSSHPTITNCTFLYNAVDQSTPPHTSGAMYNWLSNPAITNCLFEGNSAGDGGGIGNEQSSPTITGCQFVDNSAGTTNGGAIINLDASPSITDCEFTNNGAYFSGGAIRNSNNSNADVTGCTFTGNTAGAWGGGISNYSSSPTVTDCTFDGNTAIDAGGGLSSFGGQTTIADCLFINNAIDTTVWPYSAGALYCGASADVITSCVFVGNSSGYSGAITAADAATPTITNCLFVNNQAVVGGDGGGGGGGAVAIAIDAYPSLINCTFVGNNAEVSGGAIYTTDEFGGHSETTIANSVIHGNSEPQIDNVAGGVTIVEYSLVEGGYPGDGNIDEDPLFVDPGNSDYHLSAGSPCIDAANNRAVPDGITTDLDGNPRFVDDPDTVDTGYGTPPFVDMGAYEFQGAPAPCPCDCEATPDGTVDVGDFLALLAQWGAAGTCDCEDPPDGAVDVGDFLALLAAWGPCP